MLRLFESDLQNIQEWLRQANLGQQQAIAAATTEETTLGEGGGVRVWYKAWKRWGFCGKEKLQFREPHQELFPTHSAPPVIFFACSEATIDNLRQSKSPTAYFRALTPVPHMTAHAQLFQAAYIHMTKTCQLPLQ